jgi:hypothetical protein
LFGKKKSAEQRATDLVDELANAIENHDNGDGTTGMPLKKWQRFARDEIAKVIRDVELTTTLEDALNARRFGGKMLRIGFMLLAASFSFVAFWGGIVMIGQAHGFAWGLVCAISATVLATVFVFVGLFIDQE